MKLYTFSLILSAILIFSIGCHTENPICSDNYCVSGEIFLRSQLLEGEEYSEIDIVESDLIASFAGATPRPIDTTIDTDVNITETDILTVANSLKNNEPTFKGAFISVDAIVDKYTTDNSGLYLRTQVGEPEWLVSMFVKDFHFNISSLFPDNGKPHNFILWVSSFENNKVYCRAFDPANITSGRSALHGDGSVINTTVSEIVDSVKKGESYFLFKKVIITAPIVDIHKRTNQTTGEKYELIELIESELDILDDKETHSFRIHPTVRLWSGEFDQDFSIGTHYKFTLIIHYLSGRDFSNPKDINVNAYLAN